MIVSASAALNQTSTLTDVVGRHRRGDVIVCGCGPSLNELAAPERFLTIGVNDVGRLFDPTYLVVVNPRTSSRPTAFATSSNRSAQALFTQLDLGRVHPPVVRFRLGQLRRHRRSDAGESLHYTQNSPYVAVCLAALHGRAADRPDRRRLHRPPFLRHDRPPPAAPGVSRRSTREYGALARGAGDARHRARQPQRAQPPHWRCARSACRGRIDVRAPAVVPAPAARGGMRIVSYATTPVAGVPASWRAVSRRARTRARSACGRSDGYGNGVTFAGGTSNGAGTRRGARACSTPPTWSSCTTARSTPAHAGCSRGKPS